MYGYRLIVVSLQWLGQPLLQVARPVHDAFDAQRGFTETVENQMRSKAVANGEGTHTRQLRRSKVSHAPPRWHRLESGNRCVEGLQKSLGDFDAAVV